MKYNSIVDELKAKDIAVALSPGQHEGNVILTIEGIGQQEIKVVSSPSNIRGFVKFVICPACNKRVKILYYRPEKTRFLCRRCSELQYLTQYDRAYRKTPYQRKKIKKKYRLKEYNSHKEPSQKLLAELLIEMVENNYTPRQQIRFMKKMAKKLFG